MKADSVLAIFTISFIVTISLATKKYDWMGIAIPIPFLYGFSKLSQKYIAKEGDR